MVERTRTFRSTARLIELEDELPSESEAQPNRITPWILRLLMAALLLFGSEILLWIDPPSRTIEDWALLAGGYFLLGTLALDLAARFRIRSVYDAMAVVGIVALYNGLLLNPETALSDFPGTFMTQVIGAHSLLEMEMFGLFLALTGGANRRIFRLLLGFSLWVGFYWGIWLRWTPSETDWLHEEVALTTMALWAGVLLAVIGVLAVFAGRRASTGTPDDLQVTVPGLGMVGIIGAGLLIYRASQIELDAAAVTIVAILTVLGLAILWFQRPTKGAILLDAHYPPILPPVVWIGAAIVIFTVATAVGYHLPKIDVLGYSQVSLMEYGFVAVGTLWWPVIAAVVSIDGLDRIGRMRRW